MRKKKEQKNYLELIPEKNETLNWYVEEEAKVVLEIVNNGVFQKLTQKLLKKPKTTKIHLDENGSFLWPLIDGEKTVMELAEFQKAQFGEAAEPLDPRIVKYFQILESYGFVSMK